MNYKWRILNFTKNSASENMSIDEAIFRLYGKIKINTIRFYGWSPSAVSIGKNQDVENEVDLVNLNNLGYSLVRRITGGGAVFHDEFGELTYSIIVNPQYLDSSSVEGSYYELVKLILEPIENLGLSLDYQQIHCPSVFSGGKKISGNAQARSKDAILQHGTILLKIRPEIMYSVLKARPGRTRQNMIESVYQNVTTISDRLKHEFNGEELAHYIIQFLIEKNPSQYFQGVLEHEEKELTSKLIMKYKSKDWIKKNNE